MEKVMLLGLTVIIGYITAKILTRKATRAVTTEEKYREYCKYAGYVYIANRTIREGLLDEEYIYIHANSELEPIGLFVHLGFICHDQNILESLQQALKIDALKQLTFYQTYESFESSLSGLVYPSITKDHLDELLAMENDREFLQWLKRKKPFLVDGETFLPIDADSIVGFGMPVLNFDLSILEELSGSKLQTLLFGQGTLKIAELEKYLSMFPNLSQLELNNIIIDNTEDEITDFFVNYCNNSKIDSIDLWILSKINPQLIESRLKRSVTLYYKHIS